MRIEERNEEGDEMRKDRAGDGGLIMGRNMSWKKNGDVIVNQSRNIALDKELK